METHTRTYTILGIEGDLIVVREQGSLTIRDVDPAIQRQMPSIPPRPKLVQRLSAAIEKAATSLTTQNLD